MEKSRSQAMGEIKPCGEGGRWVVVVANGAWHLYPLLSGSWFQLFSKGKWAAISPDKSSRVARSGSSEVASKEKMALPELPSIAVLPFVNMSKDPDQEFLCDGMTEDIITALSKVPRLFVIARNSTFTYKGKPVRDNVFNALRKAGLK